VANKHQLGDAFVGGIRMVRPPGGGRTGGDRAGQEMRCQGLAAQRAAKSATLTSVQVSVLPWTAQRADHDGGAQSPSANLVTVVNDAVSPSTS